MTTDQFTIERKKRKDKLILALNTFNSRLEEEIMTIEQWKREIEIMRNIIQKKLREL